MTQSFVIIESLTKATTLSKYLGRNDQVRTSVGPLKDLPKSTLSIDLELNCGDFVGWPASTANWNGCRMARAMAGKNALNSQHNLPVPYAVLMISTRKNLSYRDRWIETAPFLP